MKTLLNDNNINYSNIYLNSLNNTDKIHNIQNIKIKNEMLKLKEENIKLKKIINNNEIEKNNLRTSLYSLNEQIVI